MPDIYQHSDELLDELDATLLMFGRLLAARHGAEQCHAERITGPRLLVLHLLSVRGTVKAGDLAQMLGVKAPATTALLDALESDGLIRRERSAEDRRVNLVTVTDKGLSAMREVEGYRREKMRDYLSVLTEQDVRDLIRIQRTLISAFIDDQS